MTRIKEIFDSIQGEGPYIGYKQLFVRFCNCNLKCNYCDTEFAPDEYFEDFTPQELADYIKKFNNYHSISLTGGEPLLSTEFLKEFLPLVNNSKIYLETNATLADKLAEVIDFVDIIAADIKLESATGIKDTLKFHDKFFEIAKQKECFAKIVFNDKITDQEIFDSCELANKYNFEIILQPAMDKDKMTVTSDFCEKILNHFLKMHSKTRLIPQVHKFLNVR
ncbi:7-carboxy-7-deazaguanine synthase QueE [bacterium]|nr:7-carboxy-7-deazaguanine synthase QueE [bacterium]